MEWLGVDLSQVQLVTGDTDVTVVGGGAHSARALRLAAVVMAKASDRIVEKGTRIAAWLLEAADADIEFAGRRFTVKGTDRSVDLFEVAAAALRDDAPADCRGPLDGRFPLTFACGRRSQPRHPDSFLQCTDLD